MQEATKAGGDVFGRFERDDVFFWKPGASSEWQKRSAWPREAKSGYAGGRQAKWAAPVRKPRRNHKAKL